MNTKKIKIKSYLACSWVSLLHQDQPALLLLQGDQAAHLAGVRRLVRSSPNHSPGRSLLTQDTGVLIPVS